MLKKLVSLLVLGVMFSCSTEPAIAKGFSSSYGGSRSYSAPARSSPTVTHNVTVNKTTIVHNSSGGGSGSGLLTGMLIGEAVSGANRPVVIQAAPVTPVMVAPPQQIVEQVPAPVQQVIASQPVEESHWFAWFLIIALMGIIGVYIAKKEHVV